VNELDATLQADDPRGAPAIVVVGGGDATADVLRRRGFAVVAVDTVEQALARVVAGACHLLVTVGTSNGALEDAVGMIPPRLGMDEWGGLTVREMERRLIVATLRRTGNNRTQAAKLLGISIRTLRNKLAEYRARGALPLAPEPRS
jgi:Fis family transcriptional regulator, factor for inversion stimulation protein